jgi:hypothetical protein
MFWCGEGWCGVLADLGDASHPHIRAADHYL